MVEFKIDKKNKAPLEMRISGNSIECAEEVSIILVELCSGISTSTGNSFDDVFTSVVAAAKMIHFFKAKEEKRDV